MDYLEKQPSPCIKCSRKSSGLGLQTAIDVAGDQFQSLSLTVFDLFVLTGHHSEGHRIIHYTDPVLLPNVAFVSVSTWGGLRGEWKFLENQGLSSVSKRLP